MLSDFWFNNYKEHNGSADLILHEWNDFSPLNNTETNFSNCWYLAKPEVPRMQIVVDVYVVSALCLIGFVGNALSIAVLYRDNDKRNTTTWLLQTLAVVDTIYLLACVVIQPLSTIYDANWIPALQNTFPYMGAYMWAAASIAQTITVWTVLLVTLDRYMAICKPFHTQMRSLERAKMGFVFIVVCAVLYNIPSCFERKVVDPKEGCGEMGIEKTDLAKNKVFFLVYKTIMFFIFRSIGPLVALIYFNWSLIRALQMRWNNKDLTRSGKHRENITLMLVVVVGVFIVCEIPDQLLRITVTIIDLCKVQESKEMKTTLLKINIITNMLLTVNSSINFLIYCLVGKKFRKILFKMTGCSNRGASEAVSETEPLTSRTTYNNATTMTVSRMPEAEPLAAVKPTDTNGAVKETEKHQDVAL